MLGAIIGDIVGSVHETTCNKNPDVVLRNARSTFTDDTVCSLAVAQWLLEDGGAGNPGQQLRNWTLNHRERGFGANFLHWATTPSAPPQDSWGNGAAMRVSPVAFWARNEAEMLELAERSTHPSHGHAFSALGAQATCWAIEHAFSHRDPERLLQDVSARWAQAGYGDLTRRDPVAERASHQFDISVMGTVPLAIVIAARGKSFEGAMRLCVSMGGDADTLAAIAGPIAEGLYGLDESSLAQWAMRTQDLWFDPSIWAVILDFHAHERVQGFYARHGRQAPDVAAWQDLGPRSDWQAPGPG